MNIGKKGVAKDIPKGKLRKEPPFSQKLEKIKKGENIGKLTIEEKIEKKILDILKEEKKNTSKINNEVMKLLENEVIIDYCTNNKVNAKSFINKYLHVIHYLMEKNVQLQKKEEQLKSENLQKELCICEMQKEIRKKDEQIEKLTNKIEHNNLPDNDMRISYESSQNTIEEKRKTNDNTCMLNRDKNMKNENEKCGNGTQANKESNNFLSIANSHSSTVVPHFLHNSISEITDISLLKNEVKNNRDITFSTTVDTRDNQLLFLEDDRKDSLIPFKNNADTILDELETLINTKKTNVNKIINYAKTAEKEFLIFNKNDSIAKMEHIIDIEKNSNNTNIENNHISKETNDSFIYNQKKEEGTESPINNCSIDIDSKEKKRNKEMNESDTAKNFYTRSIEYMKAVQNEQKQGSSKKNFIKKNEKDDTEHKQSKEKKKNPSEQEDLKTVMSTILEFRKNSVIIND